MKKQPTQREQEPLTQKQQKQKPPLLKHREVAEVAGVTYTTVSRWVRAGKLAPVKTVGRSQFYAREDVERLISDRELVRPQAEWEYMGVAQSKGLRAYWDKVRCGELPFAPQKTRGRKTEGQQQQQSER